MKENNAMKKILALLLALAMVFALAACGESAPAEAAPAAAEAPVAAEEAAPAEAGAKVLKLGLDSEPSTLDPYTQADGQGSMFISQSLYDGLWKTTVAGETIMMLATGYEFVEEEITKDEASDEASGEASGEPCGISLVVTLRDDAVFADGTPVTAEDVLWSFNNANNGTAGMMRLSNVDLADAYTDGDFTVVFPLYKQTPTIIEDLALIYIVNQEWCEQSEDNINVNPCPSGAFELTSWESGVGITLTKRADYYNAAEVGYDQIDVAFIPSEETRLLAFENGDFDMIFLSNSNSIDEINAGAVEGASIVVCPIQSLSGFQMDTIDHDTFKDVRVRQAVGYAIDVPTLVTAICGSAYSVADSILPTSNWAYTSCGNYDLDIEKAKSLLAEAGYSDANPFTFTCTISDVGYNTQLAEAAQAMLAEAGIVMNIDVKDGASFMNMVLTNQIEFTINNYFGSSDPAGVVNSRRPGLPSHLSNYADDELVQLLEDCCNSMEDESVRGPMWKELQEKGYEYANFVPLYESNINYAVTSAVDGESLAGSMLADGYLFGHYIQAK